MTKLLSPGLPSAALVAITLLCNCSGGDGSPAPSTEVFEVTGIAPVSGANGVALNTVINIAFSRAVDVGTLGRSSLQVFARTGQEVFGVLRVNQFQPGIVTFEPDPGFLPATEHRIEVRTSLRDTSGQALARSFESRFTASPGSPIFIEQGQIVDHEFGLKQGRWFHRVSTLPNGRFLISGGYSGNDSTTDALEVFDPVARKSTLLGTRMITARAAHVQIALPNGRVLLAGGESQGAPFVPLAQCEILNSSDLSISPAPAMNFARSFAQAVVLDGGKILVTGGQSLDGATFVFRNDAEIYDPVLNTWSVVPDVMGSPRAGHVTSRDPAGNIVIFGGSSSTLTADLYDPDSNSFTTPAVAPANPHLFGAFTRLPDGRPVVAGGSGTRGVTMWDVGLGFLQATSDMAQERVFAAAVAFENGNVLITGGTDFGTPVLLHRTIDVFHRPGGALLVERIQDVALPRPTSHHVAIRAPDGNVWLFGGIPQDLAFSALQQAILILAPVEDE
ncbi:MAG: kelch repeat-containing protein [Planctomycetota bacterium]